MLAARLLLDTNVLLAAVLEPERLAREVDSQLRNPDCTVFFSAASIWEIGIKASLGRDDFPFQPEDIHQLAFETGFVELPVGASHGSIISRLPWHHRDPFDRMLIAQAQAMPAQLLTTDTLLARYSDLVYLTRIAHP